MWKSETKNIAKQEQPDALWKLWEDSQTDTKAAGGQVMCIDL